MKDLFDAIYFDVDKPIDAGLDLHIWCSIMDSVSFTLYCSMRTSLFVVVETCYVPLDSLVHGEFI